MTLWAPRFLWTALFLIAASVLAPLSGAPAAPSQPNSPGTLKRWVQFELIGADPDGVV